MRYNVNIPDDILHEEDLQEALYEKFDTCRCIQVKEDKDSEWFVVVTATENNHSYEEILGTTIEGVAAYYKECRPGQKIIAIILKEAFELLRDPMQHLDIRLKHC